MNRIRIGIVGDYSPDYVSHCETGAALEDSARRLEIDLSFEWVPTEAVGAGGTEVLTRFDGLWAAPGSPYRSLEGALAGIRFARERGVPFFGT
jgi:CTP synthase (UTP-ammonia lyase)